jgi:hypothetical protein
MRLKKVFHLDSTEQDTKDIMMLENILQTETVLFNKARQMLLASLVTRNIAVKKLLLDKYNYIIDSADSVMLLDQTNEIRVYGKDIELPKEVYET